MARLAPLLHELGASRPPFYRVMFVGGAPTGDAGAGFAESDSDAFQASLEELLHRRADVKGVFAAVAAAAQANELSLQRASALELILFSRGTETIGTNTEDWLRTVSSDGAHTISGIWLHTASDQCPAPLSPDLRRFRSDLRLQTFDLCEPTDALLATIIRQATGRSPNHLPHRTRGLPAVGSSPA